MDNDIVLNELTDENLVLQMHDDMYDDMYDGLAAEIAEGTQILLNRDWKPYAVLNEALIAR